MATRAIIYVRVSTTRQGDARLGHVSLEAQEARCVEWARAQNIPYTVYRESVSAKTMKKQKVLNTITKKYLQRGDVLVMYSISRFSRNLADAMILMSQIRKVGAQVYFVAEGQSYDNHRGCMAINMGLVNAEFESREIGFRVRASLEMRRARGDFMGSTSPFGYKCVRLDTGKRVLVIEQAEAQIVMRILEMFEGRDIAFRMNRMRLDRRITSVYSRIAQALNAEGLQYRAGVWTPERVKRSLKNAQQVREQLYNPRARVGH